MIKVIDEFFKYCNEQKIQEAYDLLTEECKDELYSSLQVFYETYYKEVINGEKKNISVENWVNDTYKVKISEDFLSTGKYSEENTIQDYITIKKDDNNEYKLNINGYIERKKQDKEDNYKNINVKVLDEVNKGTTMGMDAIHFVSDKVGDERFKKVLDVEYGKYKKIAERIDNIYSQYASKEPHETNKMEKMMTWYGINMKTMNDQSNSKISELLMQGTNMGIIEGRRLLNNNPSVDTEVKNILNDFVVMQEDSVETLKKYL